MLCLGTPKLNFQYESPESVNKLVGLVQKYLPPEEEETNGDNQDENENDEGNQNAFQVSSNLLTICNKCHKVTIP